MAVYMGMKQQDNNDAQPPVGRKMNTNTKNPALTKNPKKEKEWHKTLSVRYIPFSSYLCPIAPVKSLDSSLKDNIHVELD